MFLLLLWTNRQRWLSLAPFSHIALLSFLSISFFSLCLVCPYTHFSKWLLSLFSGFQATFPYFLYLPALFSFRSFFNSSLFSILLLFFFHDTYIYINCYYCSLLYLFASDFVFNESHPWPLKAKPTWLPASCPVRIRPLLSCFKFLLIMQCVIITRFILIMIKTMIRDQQKSKTTENWKIIKKI